MKKVQPEEGESADIVSENIERLKELFPDALSEGGVDFDALRQLLGDANVLDEGEEKYGLNWHGKKKARQIALTPSTGTLLPCPEESVDWDTTKNLFIEGDNLEVLKLLQKSYANRVKMIYIDPPYNTGKEFIYPDKFQENLDTYLKYTGQVDDEGMKFSSNTESTGRKHTNWLSMMYPRLKLAQSILTRDGMIFISIDDNEFANLVAIANEIFGEENQIAVLVWDRNRKNDAKYFSVGHEYMLVYAKDVSYLKELDVILREPKQGIDEARELYLGLKKKHKNDNGAIEKEWRDFYRKIKKSDPRKLIGRYSKIGSNGPYRDDGNISWPGGGGPKYEVLHPVTNKPCKVPDGGWRYSNPVRFWEEVEAGKVVFGDDETTLPRQYRELFESDGQVMTSVHYSYAQNAAVDFNNLMDDGVFQNPKNYKDIQRIIEYVAKDGDIVLDFFAGSATTAHAVLASNAKLNERKRYILVQLPEKITEKETAYKAGYKTISDIAKERIKRASRALIADIADDGLDIGFKCFTLADSNIQAWNPDRADLEESLLSQQEHLIEGRSEQDILYELLLKRGVDLAVPIESRQVNGKTVYSIGYGVLFACLDESISKDQVEEIGQAIVDWHRELAPSSDTHVFFRDSAFRDDVSKTNMAAILEQNGINHVRSL